MSDIATRWGHLIRAKREAADLTQVALGARVGRPQATISRWESGSQSPTLTDQQRLISVLRISAEELRGLYETEPAA